MAAVLGAANEITPNVALKQLMAISTVMNSASARRRCLFVCCFIEDSSFKGIYLYVTIIQ